MALRLQMPLHNDNVLPSSSSPSGSPPSRPNSPYRPSSRSERLLRDTLRKADLREHSLTRRRRSDDAADLDELAWLYQPPPPPPLSRTQTSPSPTHQHHRPSYSLSAMPIPRPSTTTPTPASSLQQSAPHDAALRARLENALSRVSSAQDFSSPSPSPKGKAVSHVRTRSLAGSPIVSTEWPWTGSPDSTEPAAPLTPPPTPPPTVAPLAPPSPFNARAASQICRQLPGYVSFQDVEGLGEPPSAEMEEDERAGEDKAKDEKKWWNWPWTTRARAQSQ